MKTHFKMEKLTETSSLNINSWLINWGYMNGYLVDGIIETTKFGVINQRTCILSTLLTGIKFFVLLFHPKESQIANQLGDFGYFLGPKVFLNLIISTASIHMLVVMLLFNLGCKNAKIMFYWLNILDYDILKQGFYKANLNESDSKMMIKRISFIILTLKWFTYALISLFTIATCSSVFKYCNDYHLNYIISILLFSFQLYYYTVYVFGFPIIFYQVSNCRYKTIS